MTESQSYPSSALVLGANGYIGFAVAQVLRQNGFKVYGLVRKQEHATRLAKEEIIPVVGDAADTKTYEEIIKVVDVVIDVTADWTGSAKTFNLALQTVERISSDSPKKKIFVGTSGILAHAPSSEIQDDEDTNLRTGKFIEERLKYETNVVSSKKVHGVLLRPGAVYGYAGGNGGIFTDSLFEVTEGKIVIFGSLEKVASWVHVYDTALAYFFAVKKYEVAAGQKFNIVSPFYPTAAEWRKKAVEVAGYKDAEISQLPVPEGNPIAAMMEGTLKIYPKKAQNLLGWFPTHRNIIDDLENVHQAYAALKNQAK